MMSFRNEYGRGRGRKKEAGRIDGLENLIRPKATTECQKTLALPR
jgi:hypothetical protein